MSSHEVLNFCWNVPNDPDEERRCRTDISEAQAPAEGPSSNQFEQGLDNDDLSICKLSSVTSWDASKRQILIYFFVLQMAKTAQKYTFEHSSKMLQA